MAVDEALMESVRAGAAPALRVYAWEPACLTLGRNQPAAGLYNAERIQACGADIVRRPTGGRAVLHEAELTYSVVMPDRMLGSARRAYHALNLALARALARLGASVVVSPVDPTRATPVPSTAPCFAEPVSGELLAGGRKLIGSAQTCVDGILLQHGSIPLRAGRVGIALEKEGLVALGDPAHLERVIGAPVTFDELAEAIRAAWSEGMGPCEDADLSPGELSSARRREERYRDDSWTWRR